MIYPMGNAVYENMNTSFTNFGELLADLKANTFTGSVQISFWEYEGNLFLDNGNIVNAVEEIDGERTTGKLAVEQLKGKAQEKGGSISVYTLGEEMVTLLASVVQSEQIYRNLSTDFTSVDGLIGKLKQEDHTGYVEVNIEEAEEKSYIYFLSGKIIDCLVSRGSDKVSGKNILPRIIEAAATKGATFNVYSSAIEKSFAEGEEIRVSHQFPKMLEVWGEVIEAVEATADEMVKPGAFLNTFKETLIDHAVDYPYLDPFAAKFQYEKGQIAYHGEPEKSINQGLGICLSDTIQRLEDEYPKRKLGQRIEQSLQKVKADRAADLERLGIAEHLPG